MRTKGEGGLAISGKEEAENQGITLSRDNSSGFEVFEFGKSPVMNSL